MKENTFDVIIIGGGITGAGTARDCALRGLKVLLLERFDYTAGATSRNHGLLHSGARYAMTDPESAGECIRENLILKKIAPNCVEENGGLFISLPEDDISFHDQFIIKCREAGINAKEIDPDEAIRMEPSVNPDIRAAVAVPDGSVDPFRLTMANILDARNHGAITKVYHKVVDLIREKENIIGITAYSTTEKRLEKYYAPVTINAGGIWGHAIAQLAGININMYPAKGALLIFGHRVNNVVINRCRKPSDADILVPGDTISLIGTTSSRVPYGQIDNMFVTPEEVDLLLREGQKLAPTLKTTRILRAYAGVRPLIAKDNDPTGRNISRGIVLLDHKKRDGLGGFITITGGKLMTYRLMAEMATDLVCEKLHRKSSCSTASLLLPGSGKSEEKSSKNLKRTFVFSPPVRKERAHRFGELAVRMNMDGKNDSSLICECENVTVGEVKFAIRNLDATDLISLRRRTRIGMGTCQGELCSCRAAGLLADNTENILKVREDLRDFLNERWKGIRPISWGDTLRETQFSSWLYNGVCDLGTIKENKTTDI